MSKFLEAMQQLAQDPSPVDADLMCWAYVQGARSSIARPYFTELLYDHFQQRDIHNVAQLIESLKFYLFIGSMHQAFVEQLWSEVYREHTSDSYVVVRTSA